MNRFFQIFNFLGIMILAGLCALQCKSNTRLTYKSAELEAVRLQQTQKLHDNQGTIKSLSGDLDDFHQRLTLSEAQLKDLDEKLTQEIVEKRRLATERDNLQTGLKKWMAAVADRDKAINTAGDQIKTIAADRNDLVQKLNDLVAKYNDLVRRWNDKQAKH